MTNSREAMTRMFPQSPASGTDTLPTEAVYWLPDPDDLHVDSSVGYFHDTWLIKDIPVEEAQHLIGVERQIAEVIDRLASDAEAFERLAIAVEYGDIDDPDHDLSDEERAALVEVVPDPQLEGLDLGVAGLVNALAAVRIIPAASCRSHAELSWSESPVVIFAASEFSARVLQPLVAASGCTFELDADRPELLAVRGRSIANTMDLAEAVMSNRETFVQSSPVTWG